MGFNIKINGEKEILLEEHELTSVQFFQTWILNQMPIHTVIHM